jgi:hypothetical protein
VDPEKVQVTVDRRAKFSTLAVDDGAPKTLVKRIQVLVREHAIAKKPERPRQSVRIYVPGRFFRGTKGKLDRVGALWFEVRGLRVLWRAASRNESRGGRASSRGAAERYLVSPGRAAQEELKVRRR